jgi:hypothetical protein
LTGEARSDATDADRSVLANDPTFTSCLISHYGVSVVLAVLSFRHFGDGYA